MKKRVLLVDDEEGFTRLLKLNLERTGQYEVRVENWGGAAAPTAKEFKPDILLLDVIMPQMFGGDVATQFKADPELQHVPIVFLSASVKRQRVEEHEGVIGGYPFIAKPAPLETVIESIEKFALKRE
ncbi:MAG: response regulator [Verrucomicrobiota bacterium]